MDLESHGGMRSIEIRRAQRGVTGWSAMDVPVAPVKKKRSGGTKKRAHRERLHRSLTTSQWRRILIFWDARCAYCGTFGSAVNPITKDCILPISKKGIYAEINIVPACSKCNSGKSSSNVFEWMRKRGLDDMEFEYKCQEWWSQWT